jgi:hypothetical protein
MSRTIRISDAVWDAIAGEGRFGETEDDVLRRKYGLPTNAVWAGRATHTEPANGPRMRRTFAKTRMSSYVTANQLHVEFSGGSRKAWPLPDRKDKLAIKQLRETAVSFARQHGASHGQENAVRKALTSAGYHVTK